MRALLLRADAGPQIGLGHVMRCLALAEPWLQSGSAVTLLTAAPSPAVRARADSLGVSLRELAAPSGSPTDAAETIALAQSLGAAWLVLDGYHFNADYQRAVKAAGLRLLVFDDTGHAAHYSADFILNQNLGATAALYPHREPATRLLLGPRFVQLRGEFARAAAPPRTTSLPSLAPSGGEGQGEGAERNVRLLVTLGGSDPDNITAQVLSVLQSVPHLTADIILGPAYPHTAALQSAIGNRQSTITLHQNPPELPQLMARADLAICAGGTTAWELSFLGVPMVVLVLAENQRSNAEQLAATGAAVHTTTARLAADLRALVADAPRRAEMSRRARALVDGLGSFRTWLELSESALCLRRATATDARLLWEWVNEPAVRAASISTEVIPWVTHEAWFARRIADPHCVIYVAEDERGHPVGQVRFEGVRIATIDVSVASAERGRGLAALLIRMATWRLLVDTSCQRVEAWIKGENARSQRAFARAGYRRGGEKSLAGEVVVGYHFDRP
jgi:UDP-2,4-diacetamido-2,4,6-trideoxy-beta-L-altropyranose hydrolase